MYCGFLRLKNYDTTLKVYFEEEFEVGVQNKFLNFYSGKNQEKELVVSIEQIVYLEY